MDGLSKRKRQQPISLPLLVYITKYDFSIFSIESQDTNHDLTFLRTLFGLMGKLAKADGKVCNKEAAHANQCLNRLGLAYEHRQEAIFFLRKSNLWMTL